MSVIRSVRPSAFRRHPPPIAGRRLRVQHFSETRPSGEAQPSGKIDPPSAQSSVIPVVVRPKLRPSGKIDPTSLGWTSSPETMPAAARWHMAARGVGRGGAIL
ncbi:translation initiation factor IF-2 [Striga asiatica]|uniref:Translation initiation factor IF-2 n=1 Tax=Striga asiatica TaxID=4170 RepID=A0A5A7PV03_STRAF|nr:translation initiation factor IF-2 [Striga asiatica]